MLSENANFKINNVNTCIFFTDGIRNYIIGLYIYTCISFLVKVLENVHIFATFYSNFGIILRYIWFQKMLMKYGSIVLFQDFF